MTSSRVARGRSTAFDDEPRAVAAAQPVTIVTGTDGNDVLKARGGGSRPGGRPTKGPDLVEGRGGDDDIDASGGDDVIHGDIPWVEGMGWTSEHFGGADRLKGGAGNDTIWGEGTGGPQYRRCGDDLIDGGPGDDVLFGDAEGFWYGLWAGNDRIFGGAGNDLIRGDGYSVGRVGRPGNDQIYGGVGNDFIIGDCDSISFQGAGADDLIDGGSGDDVLIGDGLIDLLGGGGNDRLLGGSGNDRLYGDSPLGVDFERLLGASDELGDLFFAQRGGEDFLDGGPGNDLIVGGAGSDEMIGGPGTDVFVFFPIWGGPTYPHIDRILDFAKGIDKLDLTLWGLDGAALDTDENGVLGDGDDAVFQDGEGNLVIDLGSATGLADPEMAVVILERVTSLRLDDLVPLPAPA